MIKTVVIVAGGKGNRMESTIPKQFLPINGTPILMHTINKFHKYNSEIKIIIVLPKQQINFWKNLCKKYNFNIKHTIVEGGEERFFSVKNALKIVPELGLIAIHDGVRPLVSTKIISNGFLTAEKYKTAVPVVKENNSIRILINNENKHFDRNKIRIVQTPQIFDAKILKEAYNVNFSDIFTDDASVVEAKGHKIFLFEGNIENIKITTKFDLETAKILLSNIQT